MFQIKILAATALALFGAVSAAEAAEQPAVGTQGRFNIVTSNAPVIALSNGDLFISGQTARVKGVVPDFARDGHDDVADQAKIILDNICVLLSGVEFGFDVPVQTTIYAVDDDDGAEFSSIYEMYKVGQVARSTSRIVQVSELPGDALLEVVVTTAR